MGGLVRKSDFWEGIELDNEWLVGSNDRWAHKIFIIFHKNLNPHT